MKEDVLIKNMENTSEHPLLNLVTHITIAEDFPLIKKIYLDGGHPIDMIIKTELKRIYDDNAYKFLNQLRIEEFIDGLYKYIKGTINIYFSLFNETEKLYDKVCNDNPEYRFIAYSEKPTLAHLTQLFPMIERKVRKIGEFFGISPICENIDKYHKLKEPYSVLHKIINFIYEETKQLSYASDFIFVHFALFAENGLNIRNDCIHGNGYNISDSEIMYAFKITLFCLNLLEYRMGLMLGKH